MKLSWSLDEFELIMIDLDMYLKNKYHSTVGFTIFPNIVALVHKISLHVECTRDSRNISLIYLEVR